MDNDNAVSGPGANVWGYHWAGTLYDLASACGDAGMVDLNTIRRWRLRPGSDWPDCAPDCVISQVFRGPDLICED